MAETQSGKKKFEWVPFDGKPPEIYSNYAHTSWSLTDVRLALGVLKPDLGESSNFIVEERGYVVLSWPQAKVVADMLTELIASYESVNGVIEKAALAPAPGTNYEG